MEQHKNKPQTTHLIESRGVEELESLSEDLSGLALHRTAACHGCCIRAFLVLLACAQLHVNKGPVENKRTEKELVQQTTNHPSNSNTYATQTHTNHSNTQAYPSR